MNDSVTGTVADQTQESVQVSKPGKQKGSVDVIHDIVHEVELLTKVKALNEAARLADNIEQNYFKLGGVLKVIYDNAWFEGSASFDAFVYERYGFQSRKAKYLMEIYENLATKSIPWEKVSHLGWTKLKDLAKVLTKDNVDEWVLKAEQLTVAQLLEVIKGGGPEGEGKPSVTTTSDTSTMKFKVKNDQVETIQSALSKAKAEGNTEYDSVALELICAGYLGNSVTLASASLIDVMKGAGWKDVLAAFDQLWPEIDITVDTKQ